MKSFKITIISACILTLISVTAFAAGLADNESGGAGSTLVVASDTNSASPTFEFTPSPSTLIAVYTDENIYSLAATSSKTTTDNGVVYGVLSSASAVFQLAQSADGENVTLAAADALPGSFVDKAGNTTPQ